MLTISTISSMLLLDIWPDIQYPASQISSVRPAGYPANKTGYGIRPAGYLAEYQIYKRPDIRLAWYPVQPIRLDPSTYIFTSRIFYFHPIMSISVLLIPPLIKIQGRHRKPTFLDMSANLSTFLDDKVCVISALSTFSPILFVSSFYNLNFPLDCQCIDQRDLLPPLPRLPNHCGEEDEVTQYCAVLFYSNRQKIGAW